MCQHCNKVVCSGLWEVVTRRETVYLFLCAECGLTRIANRVRAFTSRERDARGKVREETIFYKDVTSVRLMSSITRPSGPLPLGGLKGDTLDTEQPAPLTRGAQMVMGNRPQREPPNIHPSITNRKDWSYRDD